MKERTLRSLGIRTRRIGRMARWMAHGTWDLLAEDVKEELTEQGLKCAEDLYREVNESDHIEVFYDRNTRFMAVMWGKTLVDCGVPFRTFGCVCRGKLLCEGDRILLAKMAKPAMRWFAEEDESCEMWIAIPCGKARLIRFAEEVAGMEEFAQHVEIDGIKQNLYRYLRKGGEK